METPQYDIGGRRYRLELISLGQLQHILRLLQDVSFTDLSPQVVIASLGDKVSDLLACVLIPEGKSRTDVVQAMDGGRAYEEIQHLRGEMNWPMAFEVLADFLRVNPVGSLPALWARLNEGLTGWKMQMMNGSPSSASLQGETSRNETLSVAS